MKENLNSYLILLSLRKLEYNHHTKNFILLKSLKLVFIETEINLKSW